MSGAGDLISTTTDSSMASSPCSTPAGCRPTSPGPMMNSSEPTVDFTLPLTTYAIELVGVRVKRRANTGRVVDLEKRHLIALDQRLHKQRATVDRLPLDRGH